MRREGLTVVNDLAAVPWAPEAIHGHHAWETTLAGLRWPQAGLISFCHGAQPWQEAPCRLPWVHRYVVVGEASRNRLVGEEGIAPEKVETLFNFVDLARHGQHVVPASPPRRVLVLSNHLKRGRGLDLIETACHTAGFLLEVVGEASGQAQDDPRPFLARADVVLALGRSALEAMATGCALIVCGTERLGPVVTPENFDFLRARNFGFTCLTDLLTPERLAERLRSFDPKQCAAVTLRVRGEAGLEPAVNRLESLYAEAMKVAVCSPVPAATVAACAAQHLAAATAAWKLGSSLQALCAQRTGSDSRSCDETETWFRRRDAEAKRLTAELAKWKERAARRKWHPPARPLGWNERLRDAFAGLVAMWLWVERNGV